VNDTSTTQPACTHPQHLPPMHLYIPPGQEFVHKCPACGYTVTLRNPIAYPHPPSYPPQPPRWNPPDYRITCLARAA
jgi:hypothetical protein